MEYDEQIIRIQMSILTDECVGILMVHGGHTKQSCSSCNAHYCPYSWAVTEIRPQRVT